MLQICDLDTASPSSRCSRAPRTRSDPGSSWRRADRTPSRTANLWCARNEVVLCLFQLGALDPVLSACSFYLPPARPRRHRDQPSNGIKQDLLFSLTCHFSLQLCPLAEFPVCLGARQGIKVALADGEEYATQLGCDVSCDRQGAIWVCII